MDRFMRHLSRHSLRKSWSHESQMLDKYHSTDTSQTDSVITDSETSSIEDSQPPRIPPPPPPNPPPRRRRKQRSVFYSSTPSLVSPDTDTHAAVRPMKRPSIPPPIPPRSVSITGECSQTCSPNQNVIQYSESNTKKRSSDENLFSKEELIDKLTQNLSVMEELNESLRKQLKQSRDENSILVNELAAINIERNQLLQTCKEIDALKDNEWVCSICLDDRPLIVSTDRHIVTTFCGHLFCNICVNMALGLEHVCPTCRKPLPNHQKRPPYIFLYF